MDTTTADEYNVALFDTVFGDWDNEAEYLASVTHGYGQCDGGGCPDGSCYALSDE